MAETRSPATETRAATSPLRVLVVVDDPALTNVIDLTLRHGSYTRQVATTVADARAAISQRPPQLLLVDIDIDDRNALDLIDDVRALDRVAVIALTRRSDLRGKMEAFERGADDYIGVPFVPDDLVARMHAVTRRTHGVDAKMIPRVRIGELEIDVLNRRVFAGTSELHLTSLEQALLYLLAANAGTVLTREKILDALWGTDFVVESNVVDRHVRSLRAKLQNDWRNPRYIETVAGAGYRFLPDGPT